VVAVILNPANEDDYLHSWRILCANEAIIEPHTSLAARRIISKIYNTLFARNFDTAACNYPGVREIHH